MSKASRIPRVISVLLALSLLLSLLPGALAAEPQLTRADLAVMVYNKFLPTATGEAPNFTDLGSCSEEQKTAINTLAAAGILSGTQEGTFEPDGRVTRVQAAIIIWRALGSEVSDAKVPFQDIPVYGSPAVSALYEMGVLTDQDGSDGRFLPHDPATAEQVQIWLNRITMTRAELARLVYAKFRPAALPPEDKPFREEYFTDIGPVVEGQPDPCTDSQRTAIGVLYSAYILDGQSDGLFNPKGAVTRAEAVVILWRAAGRGTAEGNPSHIFNNVPTNYRPAFDYLVSLGVLTEADAVDGTFEINRLVSYEDVIKWLSRLLTRAELADMLYQKFKPAGGTGNTPFEDIGSCTARQCAAIQALAAAGIVSGTSSNRFSPNVPATYGAAAMALCRAASEDYAVSDLKLALAYLEVKGILTSQEAADVSGQPGHTITAEVFQTWLDKVPASGSGEPQPEELALDVASEGRMVVQIHLEESAVPPEGNTLHVMVARYDNGKMTALDTREITEEKLCLLTLPDGSGTFYRVFLLDGSQHPLCAADQVDTAAP